MTNESDLTNRQPHDIRWFLSETRPFHLATSLNRVVFMKSFSPSHDSQMELRYLDGKLSQLLAERSY